MRIVIFGASGQTGRLLAGQALAAGHDVAAVTRRPARFPFTRGLVCRAHPRRRGLALAGRGVTRRTGLLIMYAYAVFVITVVITAIRTA